MANSGAFEYSNQQQNVLFHLNINVIDILK